MASSMEYTVLEVTKITLRKDLYVSHMIRLTPYTFIHHREIRKFTFKDFNDWVSLSGWPTMCDVFFGAEDGFLPIPMRRDIFAPSDTFIEDFPYIIVVKQR